VARADTIVQNGHIWTGRHAPRAGALAIAGGRIAAIGEPRDVANLRGRETRVVDLGGRTLLPGFVDAHAHIWKIGHLLTTLLDLRRADSLAALGARVRARAAALPPGACIQGRGYNEARFAEGRGPTRHDLDAICADRPVVLMRTCAHIVVCNSVALERAGVTSATPPPPGGEIDRAEDGRPTGVLRETAMGLVLGTLPAPTADEYAAMVVAALNHQLSLGITSTTDAGVSPALLDVYRDLAAREALAARVNVMALDAVDGVGRVALPAATYASGRLRIDTVKFFADGGLSGATAALSVPYRHAASRGVLRLDASELVARAREPHRAGWRIATHAIGDAAIEQVLTAYERLGRGPQRHRIEHFGLPAPSHLARAATLGVIAAPQTIFIREMGRNFRRYVPDQLQAQVYPVRAMLAAGLTVALSSDAPVVEDDSPLSGMQAAICRRDEDGHDIAPAERISIEEALDAYTRAGAVASGDEHERGTLQVGMQADMVILSGNPFQTPPGELTSLGVTETWVAGRQVYES
jgi:predicted amidohydrolase YtcJ